MVVMTEKYHISGRYVILWETDDIKDTSHTIQRYRVNGDIIYIKKLL